MEINLANRIAKECLAKFESLPKTGKPDESFEWTILSGIVLERTNDTTGGMSEIRVVALGTGTKCLGGHELSARGDLVNDSHAEVLTRRALLRYLLEQIENASGAGKESIFDECGGKFKLKDGYSFHFFTTHSPCGDASIFESATEDDVTPSKRPRMEGEEPNVLEPENVGCCIAASVGEGKAPPGMTGGKMLQPEAHGDLMAQTTGPVRTKPGRGVRTLSVSCSDKLARWNVLGVQGSVLMLLLARPIYLQSVVLCDGTDHSVAAVERAIWRRFDGWAAREEASLLPPFPRGCPVVVAANNGLVFKYRKNRMPSPNARKFQPSPCGIVWCDVTARALEVEVAGRRHGVTKRKLATPAARLQISKIELFNRFARTYRHVTVAGAGDVLNNLVPLQRQVPDRADEPGLLDPGPVGVPEVDPPRRNPIDIGKLSYAAVKALSSEYVHRWRMLRERMFGEWTEKPARLGQFFTDVDAQP